MANDHRRMFEPRAIKLFMFALVLIVNQATMAQTMNNEETVDEIGVILDLRTRVGKEIKTSMEMAIRDLQDSRHSRVVLMHLRDSHGDPVEAASTAVDLINNQSVKAIVGLQTRDEAAFVDQLATMAQVPVLSFSRPYPPCTTCHSTPTFLIHMAYNDSLQMRALAAIISSHQWKLVNVIHDEADSTTGIFPFLNEALLSVGAKIEQRSVLPTRASLHDMTGTVRKDLQRLRATQSRVFVVHITSMDLANLLLVEAKRMGMMNNECVWLITDPLTALLDSMDSASISLMQGVIGVKTSFIHKTHETREFFLRFRQQFLSEYPEEERANPSIYALHAYDLIMVLAQSMKSVGAKRENNSIITWVQSHNATKRAWDLRVSLDGPQLIKEITSNVSRGFSGDINFANKELHSSIVQIINVVGQGYRDIGFWSPETGFSRDEKASEGKSTSINNTPSPLIFPGGPSVTFPKGWVVPSDGKKMRIGVPLKTGFKEFVEVKHNKTLNTTEFRGFCIDVFYRVLDILPYELRYEFIPYVGSYNDLVYEVNQKRFDAIVGDVTILANRSQYVDFSHPFAESGFSLLVTINDENSHSAWMFMMPFTMGMWLVTGALFIYTSIVVWCLEHKNNPDFGGSLWDQIGTVLWFTFSTLFFSHRENVKGSLSRMVIAIWLFVVLILTSSYTASLTNTLTIKRLDPTDTSIESLLRNKSTVGCQHTSFMVKYLEEVLGFDPVNIKKITSADELSEALSNGTITAAFIELPYIKVFLSQKKCKGFTINEPTYRVGGVGFVFPLGSPLTSDVSKAILKIKEHGEMLYLERKWLFSTECSKVLTDVKDDDDSLSLDSFWGLFLITSGTTTLVLLLFFLNLLHGYRHLENVEDGGGRAKSMQAFMVALYKYWDEPQIQTLDMRIEMENNGEHSNESSISKT
ncbi:glutamate receptor 2.7 [Amborella trichopoda]|uniref:Glutamate receptor n=1 Tax=Amborella trichopoda TaxID=13333 RepID=W1NF70_AMBTC|nr:glutamate receptor 2.7 [Amborella trichopoda]ERM94126.1 hypothetical protein AMTR_s00010p00140830 [Amborella trichopoda]|eukprot:XP_020520023.1 glutamate receptor 2.7 [Amborella trichopoda]